MTLRLTLLGPPSVEDADGSIPAGLGPGKPFAILAYVAQKGQARRDELTELLWGGVPESRARNAFRQALHRLRGALGPEALPHDPDAVRLDPGSGIVIDTHQFDAALAEGRPEAAALLYGGDFLEGFETGEPGFDHWVDGERVRLRSRYLGALEHAADEALEAGDAEAAVGWTERLTEAAWLNGGAALKHARALSAAGRQAEAQAWLRGWVERHERELGESAPDDVEAALARLQGSVGETRRHATPERGGVERCFVGRQAELGWLVAYWRLARESGGTALIEGEPGIGKSRLLDEFLSRIAALDPVLVLRGPRSIPSSRVPYAPIAAALRGIYGARGLAGASGHLLSEAARLLPELRDRFELPAAGPMEDEAARLRFFEGVASVLDAVAYEQPVCLVLEDLERTDPPSRDLAYYLASRLRGSPVLFVYTAAPGPVPSDLAHRLGLPAPVSRNGGPAVAEGEDAARLEVQPLSVPSLAELLEEDAVGRGLAAADRERVARAASGNPLRARMLARRAADGEPLGGLPAPLSDLLWARLESCDARARRVFLVLALAHRPLALHVLAAATHMSTAAVLEAVDRLQLRGLARDTGHGVAPAHPLAAELALRRTGPAALALLAGWTADALREEGRSPAGVLAELYDRAGRQGEAYRFGRRAGDAAMYAGAWATALEAYATARVHAPDASARAELDTLIEALGGGGARIGPGRRPGTPAPVASWRGRSVRRIGLWLGAAALAAAALVAVYRAPGLLPGSAGARPSGHILRDTLVLSRTFPGGEAPQGLTGSLAAGSAGLIPLEWGGPGTVGRVDSLEGPWSEALRSPDGRNVALLRERAGGASLHIVAGARGDTLPVWPDAAATRALGWAPDGTRLLVAVAGPDRDFDLYAVPVGVPGDTIAIDTAADRSVVDATWAPTGTRIAWTTRTGPSRQRDVFVAGADGRAVANVSRHPAEDYNADWSPDARRVVFTSERNGNADLYAFQLDAGQLWRLTWNPAHDDRALLSPSGDFLAFESTRGGEAAVYVMASWGGTPTRVTPPGQPFTHLGWRGSRPPHVSHFVFDPPHTLDPGEAGMLEAAPIYTDYVPRNRGGVRWEALDPEIVRLEGSETEEGTSGRARVQVRGVLPGVGRVAVSAAGWRADTAYLKVGSGPVTLLSDSFEEGATTERWLPLGPRRPEVRAGAGVGGSAALLPAIGANEASGVLSRTSFPLSYGLDVAVWVRAPVEEANDGGYVVALVMPSPAGTLDPDRPDFFRVASVRWSGEAQRLIYAVGREAWSDPASEAVARGPGHRIRIHVEPDGQVSFWIDGELRRRSTLRLGGTGLPLNRLQLWLGGSGTEGDIGFDDVDVTVAAPAR